MKIIFATFSPWEKGKRSPTNGMVEPMIYYFAPRAKKFVLIDQPHPGSDRVIPIIETYEKGRFKKTTKSSFFVSWLYPLLIIFNKFQTSVVFKIRDFLSILDFAFRKNDHYDIFIGLESINALAGVILKKFGFVDTVVYYVSDFSLQRYNNSLLNKLYLLLDRLAFNQADFVWDISKKLMSARIKAGLNPKTAKNPIYVPIALFPHQINSKQEKVIPASIVFIGRLKEENGPDLAIHALKKTLHQIPQAKLYILTSEDNAEISYLRDLVDKLGVHDKVFFYSSIQNQTDLINDLKKFMIGIAPYKASPNSPRWWADATKIRLYLAAGLPVVTTQVPPISQELLQQQSGLVVKSTAKQISDGIIELLKNKGLYRKMQKNALLQAKNNTWDKVYLKTLKSMGIALKLQKV